MMRPTVEIYNQVVQRYHESSTGPDGFQLRALKRTRYRASKVLYEASSASTGALAPDAPFWVNLCRLVFMLEKG